MSSRYITMRFGFQALKLGRCLVISLLGVAFISIEPVAALAHIRKDAVNEVSQAYGKFLILKEKDAQQGRLPRLSDPDAGAVLQQIWDQSLFDQKPYDASDIQDLKSILGVEINVGKAYPDIAATSTGPDANYLDEKTRGGAAFIALFADLLDATASASAASFADGSVKPDVQRLVESQINSLTQFYVGGIKDSGELSSKNRDIVASTMSKYASAITPHLPISTRQKILVAASGELPAMDAPAKAGLIAIMTAMGSRECDAICVTEGRLGQQPTTAAAAPPVEAPKTREAAAVKPSGSAQQTLKTEAEAAQPVQAVPVNPIGIQQFYSRLGKWSGPAEYVSRGRRPIKLNMKMDCMESPNGGAVACQIDMKGAKASGHATQLIVQAPHGGIEEFVVDSAMLTKGTVEQADANTLTGRSEWEQDGKKMNASATTSVSGNRFYYKSVTMENGQVTSTLTAHLSR